MVQMKAIDICINFPIIDNFISHMVQMKANADNGCGEGAMLYIPHGSDERWRWQQQGFMMLDFISHMVQMKES